MKCNVVLYLVFLILKCDESTSAAKPNIIVIIGDDIGWNDFGFHGSSQIPTPNIDSLGYNGIILDKFYTQHTCTPSRAALLTGNYPIRSGYQGEPIKGGEDRHLPLEMSTMPEKLKELGYSTYLVGKWHLGAAKRNYTPTGRGFDKHFGYWNGFVGYFDYFLEQEIPNHESFNGFDLHENFIPQWELKGKYATELFTDKTLQIIEQHNKEEPLFLILSHLAGHTGHNGTELGVPDEAAADAKYHYIEDPRRRKLADIVNIMDDSVGKVVKKLSDKNMLENSIILFFSDNGGITSGMYQNSASNWPMRGQKHTLFEGGVRGSSVIFSTLLNNRGYVNTELMHITDWFPTFYSIAGGDVSKLGQIDGFDQWKMLSDKSNSKRSKLLVNIDEAINYSAVIGYGGEFKYIKGVYSSPNYEHYFGDDGRSNSTPPYNISSILNSPTNIAIQKLPNQQPLLETTIRAMRAKVDLSACRKKDETPDFNCSHSCLFNLLNDPCETRNIVKERPIVALSLRLKLEKYFKELVPQKNKPVDLNSNPAYFNNTWATWLDTPHTSEL